MRVTYESDDLIYNRYDLIFTSYDEIELEDSDNKYVVQVHIDHGKAYINVWGKTYPQNIFNNVIQKIFQKYDEVKAISIIRCGNDYEQFLLTSNDIRIYLPDTIEELLNRLKSKHKYNLRRQKRIIEDTYGTITTQYYDTDIPNEIIQQYFGWKKESHGTIYNMSEKEYQKEYHITHAFVLLVEEKQVGIAFCCRAKDTVYLENFSYDQEYKNLSIGYLTYEMLLERLILEGVKKLYLGGGEYDYKKKFESLEENTFSGNIYRPEAIENVNSYFTYNKIKTIAIYGLGVVGNEFIHLKDKFNVILEYGIDRNKKKIDGISTFTLEQDMPNVDAMVITLKEKNSEVEKYLHTKCERVVYFRELIYGY